MNLTGLHVLNLLTISRFVLSSLSKILACGSLTHQLHLFLVKILWRQTFDCM
jgi:hypothetical protein